MIRLKATFLLLLTLLGFSNCQPNHRFEYTDPDGDCIKIMLELHVEIMYNKTDGNTAITTVPGLNYSSDVMYSCDGRTASLDLVWSDDFYLTLDFGANGMMNQWNLTKLTFEYQNANGNPHFTDPLYDSDTMEGTGEAIEKIGWGRSYRCSTGISYKLEGMGNARMTFPYIHVQVFNFTSTGDFSSGPECGSDDDDDAALYIALGAGIGGGLGLLLLIAIVGYCYWSTHRRRRDYTPISK
ncbi:uncharacterized protein [Dysidea avara]|uniref:uncharacterized protein n=1 Tax=Dysidea avara TaxID=196820 RepID=UPI0033336E0E